MTDHSTETSNGSRTESEQPPARVLSANPLRPSRSSHPPGFDSAELYDLVVVTTERVEERNRGVYHRGRGDGRIACKKTKAIDSRLLSKAEADPMLRPCAECYDLEAGTLLTDGGEYAEPERMWVCPVCDREMCAGHRARHFASCREISTDP